MGTQEPSPDEMVEAVYAFAAERMKAGASNRTVIDELIEKGLDQESATIVVNNLSSARGEAARSQGMKHLIFGSLWAIGGTAVTVATYSAASGGGRYVVAWGAIVFGAVEAISGLVMLARGK